MNPLAELLGDSPAIKAVREQVGRVLGRQTDARRLPPILIQGETGTGKGLLAQAIHRAGPRRDGPFVDVNCAAIPETLLEAEMFGFERGAFTDARQSKAGLLQVAHRGTIFLDEVGLLPEGLQAKLLKAIEEQAVRRLGSTRSQPVDVWILAATSEDLEVAARERRLREDLYHRLAVLTVTLPPLRERGHDILLLAEHFLARACTDYGLPPKRLDETARTALLAYRWPGNIRELANVMERVTLLSETSLVTAEMVELPQATTATPPGTHADGVGAAPAAESVPLGDVVGSVERAHLLEALRQTDWNISRAAARLGISRNTLRYRIEKHELRPETVPAAPRRRPEPAPAPRVTPPAPPNVPAFPGVRWQRRRLTLLRAVLLAAAGEDPPLASSRQLEALTDKVRIFGGRVEELSPTGLVAAFGHEPVEDAPSRAAHAAMAIQKAVERARHEGAEAAAVKIGIHTGQFLVGQAGGAVTIDLDSKRQAWPVLETLVAAAEPDTTLVSAATAPFLERRFELLAAGGAEPGPGQMYRLAGRERPGLGPRGRMAKFVGRQHELELLRSRLAAAMQGHGQVVGIVGDAGIGKSRLLFEFRRTLTEEPVTYLESHCVSYGSVIPYLPVLELLRATCQVAETDTQETVGAKVRRLLEGIEMELEEATPYLLWLLGVKEGTEQIAMLSPEGVQARTFEILRRMCLHASRRQPLILAIENLHWIDRTSERYIASLIEGLAGASILLLLTYRPGYHTAWMEKSYATQISLQPLSDQDSLTVIRSILQREQISESLAERIVAKAEGNPFVLEELVLSTIEEGGSHPALAVPATIQEVLLARIDRLQEARKRLIQMASVLGRRVPLRLLKAIWDEPGDLDPHLHELQRLEFLYEHGAGGEPTHVFKHALIQEVAYESLPLARRRALHAAAAHALEAFYAERLDEVSGRLAYHYSKTEESDKAVEYLVRVAKQAALGHSHVEAVTALEEALAHAERLPAEDRDRRVLDLVLHLSSSLYFLGRFRESLDLLLRHHERVEQLKDPWLTGRYYFRIGQTYSLMGNRKGAAQNVQRALEEASRCGDKATMGRAHYELARESFWTGRPLQGLEHGRNAVALLEETKERSWLGMAHWVVAANSAVMGEFAPALEALARARAIGEAMGDTRLESMALWTTGGVCVTKGDWEAGLKACEQSLERSLDPISKAQALGWLGYAHLKKEDPTQAIPLLEQAVQQLAQFRFRQLQGWFTAWLSEAFLLAGQIEKARDLATQGLDITRGVEDWYGVGVAQRVLGRLAQADGHLSEAERHLREALHTFESISARFEAGCTRLDLAALAESEGNQDALTAYLNESYRLFKDLRITRYLERTEHLARSFGVHLSEERA